MKSSSLARFARVVFRLAAVALVGMGLATFLSTSVGAATLAGPEVPQRPAAPTSAARRLRFPAHALSYQNTSTIITQHQYGLRWQHNYADGAELAIPRPSDWQGTGDVLMHLYFMPAANTSGSVQFFIRPRAFNPGDTFDDGAVTIAGSAVAVSQAYHVAVESILIPASRFGSDALWVITVQREGTEETCLGDVILMAVDLVYITRSTATPDIGLPANALNYLEGSIISGVMHGLRWVPDNAEALLTLPRPTDWVPGTGVELRLYFMPTITASGTVQFYTRAHALDPGDIWYDPTGVTGPEVAVTTQNQVAVQSITIPASRLGSRALWVMNLQRNFNVETYDHAVTLMAVDLVYTGQSATPLDYSITANALNYAAGGAVIAQSYHGLLWKPSYMEDAHLTIFRPSDWDTKSNIELRLYFMTGSAGAGNVQFFIRPRDVLLGDDFVSPVAPAIWNAAAPVSAMSQIGMQTITIPPDRMQPGWLWAIAIQREAPSETYSGDVQLLAVELRYNSYAINLPLIRK